MYNKRFDGLMVTLASMEDIESWSHGAVDNPDTVNYRTGKPKEGGKTLNVAVENINDLDISELSVKNVM